MADKPIIFSAPMVRALLGGRMTQTRRIAKITAIMGNRAAIESPDERLIELEPGEFRRGIFHYESTSAMSGPYRLPAAVGDRLWVREAFVRYYDLDDCDMRIGSLKVAYKADGGFRWLDADTDEFRDSPPWKPSIHMPRWASRLTLTVTDVRVQRLQDISREDARAEGLEWVAPTWGVGGIAESWNGDPRESYRGLWNNLHGPDAWDANPWVVALTFDVRRGNIDQVQP
jgi:hypothetical protein